MHFPEFDNKPAHELWDHCLNVEKQINSIFPPPMKLLFEEAIYSRYFILTKKRYMALKMVRDGSVKEGIEKRGVLLTRRDNANVIRTIYGEVIMKIFHKKTVYEVLSYLLDEMNNLCNYTHKLKEFIITKSIGDVDGYKLRLLPTEPKKRVLRLKELDIVDNCTCVDCNLKCKKCTTCNEYKVKCLPPHIQLAERVRSRGKQVQVGSRMEYIIGYPDNPKGGLAVKMEDPEHMIEGERVKVDPLYYIGLMENPFDEALQIGFGIEKFIKKQLQFRINKVNLMSQIKKMKYIKKVIKIESTKEIYETEILNVTSVNPPKKVKKTKKVNPNYLELSDIERRDMLRDVYFRNFIMKDLNRFCKNHGLPSSGKKDELIGRLEEFRTKLMEEI